MARIFLGIGSNEGDRLEQISRAVRGMRAIPGIELERMATIYETEPVGPPQPKYLNTVVEIATALEPRRLLDALKALERRLGRALSTQRWGPRVIDLDILLYDDRVLDEPALSIPHPRMHERRFVLEPLAQLVPDLIHPVLKQTIARLLATLPVSLHHSPFIIQH